MVIQHNMTAMFVQRQTGITENVKRKSSEKLSSGYRINRAADDAAGLAISEKMRRQVRGLTQASLNAQDGISMVQTAEGALNEVHEELQRMNELCVKASNDTLEYDDRAYIQEEISHIKKEIDRVGANTKFNEIKLFDGLLQTQTTAVVGTATINGATGTVTQATDNTDAVYHINRIQNGDIAYIPAHGFLQDMYYQVATQAEIDAYEQSWHDYDVARNVYEIALEEYTDKKRIYDLDPTAEGAVEPVRPTEPTAPELKDGSEAGKAKLALIDDVIDEFVSSISASNLSANSALADGVSSYYELRNVGDIRLHFQGPIHFTLQVGADTGDDYSFDVHSVNSSSLGVYDVNVRGNNGENARKSIDLAKTAIDRNSKKRAELGAIQNKLEHMVHNLDNVVENTTASESKLRDTEMASEIQKFANQKIIEQANQTILAQANQSKNGVLTLL